MKRRFTQVRLPPVTRDAGAEHRAERVAQGHRPTLHGQAAVTPAPHALGLADGQPLPPTERGYFERRLGADLGPVRVHPAAPAAAALGANAFAAGRDIGFAPGRYRPGTREGRRLLGHELAHVLEQGSRGVSAVQLDGPPRPGEPELKLPDKEAGEKAEAVGGGLSTLVDVVSEDPRIMDPIKDYAEARWDRLPGDAQTSLVVGGISLYGTFLAGMLSSPSGRSILSDFNLATPLALVPYGTLADIRFIEAQPGGGPMIIAGRLEADDWLRLMLDIPDDQFAPTLGLDLTWRYDPSGDHLGLSGGKVDLGLVPGLNIQAGAGVGLSWPTPVPMPMEGLGGGGTAWSMQSIPGADPSQGPAGYGGFISVDLAQLPIVPAWLRYQLGGMPGER